VKKKLLMTIPLLALVIALPFMLVGCSGYLPQNLIGEWNTVSVGNDEEFTYPGDWGWSMVEGGLMLNADGTFVDRVGSFVFDGTWWTSGNQITFRTTVFGLRVDETWTFSVEGDNFSKWQTVQLPGQPAVLVTYNYARVVV